MASMVLEILKGDALPDLVCCARNLWIALIVGVVIGWIWKPRWVNLGRNNKFMMKESSGFVSPMSFGSIPGLNSLKSQLPSCISWVSQNGDEKGTFSVLPNINSDYSLSQCPFWLVEFFLPRSSPKEKPLAVTGDDVEHLCKLVEVKDGGPAWIQMMDRSAPNMRYQAWRRDPETGPPQYRSRTVFEDATPELVRDFFWDDDFRQQAKWDDMLMHSTILEECPTTGTMVVHWVRKFPFFCSDREYIIGRRIWESGRSYYCVTKGVPNSTVPRRNKPRRVDLYYSSWCIRAVESERDGQLTACEVLLFHHEDMGIPWEIAKLGVRQGMWGTVKKIEPGLRAYQRRRASETPLSRSAFMAQINTKLNTDYLRSLESKSDSSEVEVIPSPEKSLQRNNNIPKLLIVGGVVALACSLDRGLLTKAVIFGVARRFGNIGRRL